MIVAFSPLRSADKPSILGRPKGYRGVAEWFKAAVLKTVVGQLTGGSNPSSSANLIFYKRIAANTMIPSERFAIALTINVYDRRSGRVAEGAGLLNQ